MQPSKQTMREWVRALERCLTGRGTPEDRMLMEDVDRDLTIEKKKRRLWEKPDTP